MIPCSALGHGDMAAPSNRVVMGTSAAVGTVRVGILTACLAVRMLRLLPSAMWMHGICGPRNRESMPTMRTGWARATVGVRVRGLPRADQRQRDIDVVGIATPDHWHVIPAIMAAKAGKDVICEKPLSLTVAEGRALCDTIRETRRVFQTAAEIRSIDVYLRLVEIVRGGALGKLHTSRCGCPWETWTRGWVAQRGFVSAARGGSSTQRAELRHVAGPGAMDAICSGPWAWQLPLEPRVFRRRDYGLGCPHDRPGAVGTRD